MAAADMCPVLQAGTGDTWGAGWLAGGLPHAYARPAATLLTVAQPLGQPVVHGAQLGVRRVSRMYTMYSMC